MKLRILWIMSFCLYNTNEVYNFLKHKYELTFLENWAETHNLYYDKNSHIWKTSDLDDFFNENLEIPEILEIKTSNNIPINENEKGSCLHSSNICVIQYF